MFDYAPINRKGVELVAQRVASLKDLTTFLSQVKPAAIESELARFVLSGKSGEAVEGDETQIKKSRGNQVDFALACFLNKLLEGIFGKRKIPAGKGSGKKEVRFAANYGGWMVVKKVDLTKAEGKEVLACLAGINAVVEKKACELICKNPMEFEKLVQKYARYPERKSFGKLVEVLSQIDEKELERELGALFENVSLGKEFFLERLLSHFGYPPFVSIEMINENYPELKIPKPRGRVKK